MPCYVEEEGARRGEGGEGGYQCVCVCVCGRVVAIWVSRTCEIV